MRSQGSPLLTCEVDTVDQPVLTFPLVLSYSVSHKLHLRQTGTLRDRPEQSGQHLIQHNRKCELPAEWLCLVQLSPLDTLILPDKLANLTFHSIVQSIFIAIIPGNSTTRNAFNLKAKLTLQPWSVYLHTQGSFSSIFSDMRDLMLPRGSRH